MQLIVSNCILFYIKFAEYPNKMNRKCFWF